MFSCLATVPPRGTDVYNRGGLHPWVPANIHLNIQGECRNLFYYYLFCLKKIQKQKNGIRAAHPLQVEEEKQSARVSAP